MLSKQKNIDQMGFYSTFEEQLNHNHPLYKLSLAINWRVFDDAFSKHYSATHGKPAKPIHSIYQPSTFKRWLFGIRSSKTL